MAIFKRLSWRALLVLICSVFVVAHNTAMASQMNASACHTMPMTSSMNMSDSAMDHSCTNMPVEKHDHACAGQICCFCMQSQTTATSSIQVIKPVSADIPSYRENSTAGYFSTLYRPPKIRA